MPTQPPLPSSEVRGWVSLVLFIHLFAVAIALTAYAAPSTLQERLRTLLAPYLATLNFDLNPNAYPIGPVLSDPRTADRRRRRASISTPSCPMASERSITIPEPGLWPPERRRHYQALANAASTLVESDEYQAVLPRAIAGAVLRSWGATSGSVRIERHLPLQMEEVASSDRSRSDPFSPRHYSTVYEAHVLVSPSGQVDLVKKVAAGEVAPVDKKRRQAVDKKAASRPTKTRPTVPPATILRATKLPAMAGAIDMQCSIAAYFRSLVDGVADGWNRFWFTPSDPYPLGLIRLLTGCLATYLHLTLLPDVGRLFAAGGWLPHEAVDRLTIRGGSASYLDLFSSPGELVAVQVGRPGGAGTLYAGALVATDQHFGPGRDSFRHPPRPDADLAVRAGADDGDVLPLFGSVRSKLVARPRCWPFAGRPRPSPGRPPRVALRRGRRPSRCA